MLDTSKSNCIIWVETSSTLSLPADQRAIVNSLHTSLTTFTNKDQDYEDLSALLKTAEESLTSIINENKPSESKSTIYTMFNSFMNIDQKKEPEVIAYNTLTATIIQDDPEDELQQRDSIDSSAATVVDSYSYEELDPSNLRDSVDSQRTTPDSSSIPFSPGDVEMADVRKEIIISDVDLENHYNKLETLCLDVISHENIGEKKANSITTIVQDFNSKYNDSDSNDVKLNLLIKMKDLLTEFKMELDG